MKHIILASLLIASPALAEEKTVTLTQSELQTLVQTEASKAVANFAMQQEAAKAKPVYDKLQSAFAPKPPEDSSAK